MELESKEVLKNNERMSKRHRSQIEEVLNGQSQNNNIK